MLCHLHACHSFINTYANSRPLAFLSSFKVQTDLKLLLSSQWDWGHHEIWSAPLNLCKVCCSILQPSFCLLILLPELCPTVCTLFEVLRTRRGWFLLRFIPTSATATRSHASPFPYLYVLGPQDLVHNTHNNRHSCTTKAHCYRFSWHRPAKRLLL